MSTHLEPLNDAQFAPLTPDEQDVLLGGAGFKFVGKTAMGGKIYNDYVAG
jgi:hypothetical protein